MHSVSHLKSHISNLKRYAVIVAGGSGTRMQSAVPKQFLLLNGKPVLMYTIENFYNTSPAPTIMLALHSNFHDYWRNLCKQHNFTIPHEVIAGGQTRFHSVKNSIIDIPDDALVAVQDAVRPLTSTSVIEAAYQCALEHGNAVTAVKSRDSIRQMSNGQSTALKRDEIYLVQTPQTFKANILKQAYLQEFNNDFTDDASVVERSGEQIRLVDGDYTNIKITFPEDIAIAELLLKQKSHS